MSFRLNLDFDGLSVAGDLENVARLEADGDRAAIGKPNFVGSGGILLIRQFADCSALKLKYESRHACIQKVDHRCSGLLARLFARVS